MSRASAKRESPTDALERNATAGGLTVSALADKFLEDYVRVKELRALLKYQRAIRVHIAPEIGHVLADLISRDQVRTFMKHVMVRTPRGKGGRDSAREDKEAARSALGVLRKMINWGAREHTLLRCTDNPCTGMEDNLPKKRAKERLSLEEACLAWQAAASLGYPFGPVFRLMLLTGCRSGEWSACRRSYVDLEQKMLVIPASAYKTDHFHIVPLVPETRSAVQYRRPKDCLIETVMRELSGENCAFDPCAAGLLTPLRADTSQWKARLSGLRLRTCYMR